MQNWPWFSVTGPWRLTAVNLNVQFKRRRMQKARTQSWGGQEKPGVIVSLFVQKSKLQWDEQTHLSCRGLLQIKLLCVPANVSMWDKNLIQLGGSRTARQWAFCIRLANTQMRRQKPTVVTVVSDWARGLGAYYKLQSTTPTNTNTNTAEAEQWQLLQIEQEVSPAFWTE